MRRRLDLLRTNPISSEETMTRPSRRDDHLLPREHVMGCCCNDKKTDKGQTPDCMASKSTVVTTRRRVTWKSISTWEPAKSPIARRILPGSPKKTERAAAAVPAKNSASEPPIHENRPNAFRPGGFLGLQIAFVSPLESLTALPLARDLINMKVLKTYRRSGNLSGERFPLHRFFTESA